MIRFLAARLIITIGCDRGFGETLATKLTTDGYTVYAACLDKNSEGARALGANPNINVLQINVTKQSDVDAGARQLNQDLWERGNVIRPDHTSGLLIAFEKYLFYINGQVQSLFSYQQFDYTYRFCFDYRNCRECYDIASSRESLSYL